MASRTLTVVSSGYYGNSYWTNIPNSTLAANEYITSVDVGLPQSIWFPTRAGTLMFVSIYASGISETTVGQIDCPYLSSPDDEHIYYDWELTDPSPYNFSKSDGLKYAGKKICVHVWFSSDGSTFTAPLKITVKTAINSYGITVNNSTGGTVTASASSAAPGTTITLSRSASTGYQFSAWNPSPSSLSINSSNQFTMPSSNVTISPTWTKINYTITKVVSPSGAGTITAPSTATYGATVTLKQAPNLGWAFSGWTVSSGTLSGNTLTMPAGNVTVTATYTRAEHTLVWTDPGLTISNKTDKVIKAVMTGYATDSYGEEVTYALRKGDEDVAIFAGNTAILRLDDIDSGQEIEYSVVAESSLEAVGTTTTYTANFSIEETSGYFDGTNYHPVDYSYYNGSAWIGCEASYFDGNMWHSVE